MTDSLTNVFLRRVIFLTTFWFVVTTFLIVSVDGQWYRYFYRQSYLSPSRRMFFRRRPRAIPEGAIRLIGGHRANQGNVQIYHVGRWGYICDDEWDQREANIVCRLLGYPGAERSTGDSVFGHASSSQVWMDNLYCTGKERRLQDCPFDGWGIHDCNPSEVAGVVCQRNHPQQNSSSSSSAGKEVPVTLESVRLKENNFSLRLVGGRSPLEGRVEIKIPGTEWGLVCGDGWEILEAGVVCKQLGLGFAKAATQSSSFGGQRSQMILSGVKCRGDEKTLASCRHDNVGAVDCPGSGRNFAGVICVKDMPDLVPDEKEIERSSHLEVKELLYLQCAMEENCLSSSAYQLQKEKRYGYLFEKRKLLRFTARIGNVGTADFRPFLPKHAWEWHSCHLHYHSMEVFAHFDIIDMQGNKVAEGHKASFCLEDNYCRRGARKKYACVNYGDQGISVGCTDTYLHNIDCQWVDLTDLTAGNYYFKLSVNPEFKVPEMRFDNNVARCNLSYNNVSAKIWNCTLDKP
ncbi:lysyl oxidase homolog 3A-like [Tachypleus tridentatus]|uniref:lysyl oxidase homolog 3A-like n=1 Tax=Tachypleus tridentatus TaxID=6853 RepID=UPI003FCFAF63